jgi:hypothetical protein
VRVVLVCFSAVLPDLEALALGRKLAELGHGVPELQVVNFRSTRLELVRQLHCLCINELVI